MPLTDTAIRNTKPGEKPVKLIDEARALSEVSTRTGASGGGLKYRYGGKEKPVPGVYPEWV